MEVSSYMNKDFKEVNIENKKAYHDYFVDETLECGISLKGNEIKSIRRGNCNIKDAWCRVQNGQLVIRGMHIKNYEESNQFDLADPDRERVLLAHKSEIVKLDAKVQEDGLTLVPIKVYTVKGKCKVLVGVCKGKHNFDKRNDLKEKQVKRDINRALKEVNK